jgi:hypothetical protein
MGERCSRTFRPAGRPNRLRARRLDGMHLYQRVVEVKTVREGVSHRAKAMLP